MQKQTKSLLEELEAISQHRDLSHVIENRAHNIITSAINLLELINTKYDEKTSEILERKLLSAIKGRDQARFSKSLRKNNEN
tara:strand:+ start:478 stop:723 length:246 start_codon:yes stop_codon:yes gene_type:complete